MHDLKQMRFHAASMLSLGRSGYAQDHRFRSVSPHQMQSNDLHIQAVKENDHACQHIDALVRQDRKPNSLCARRGPLLGVRGNLSQYSNLSRQDSTQGLQPSITVVVAESALPINCALTHLPRQPERSATHGFDRRLTDKS